MKNKLLSILFSIMIFLFAVMCVWFIIYVETNKDRPVNIDNQEFAQTKIEEYVTQVLRKDLEMTIIELEYTKEIKDTTTSLYAYTIITFTYTGDVREFNYLVRVDKVDGQEELQYGIYEIRE